MKPSTKTNNIVVDNLSIFRRALSNQQVMQLYKLNGHGKYASPAKKPKADFQWSFEQGELKELNGSGHDAALFNGTTLAKNRYGENSAYKTDGTNDFIQINDHNDFDFGAEDFTVSIWAKKLSATVNSNGNQAINKWGSGTGSSEWILNISSGSDGSSPPLFNIVSGSTVKQVTSSVNSTLNEWYHLVGMRDGDSIRIFVNGIMTGSLYVGNISVNNVGRHILIGKDAGAKLTNAIYDDAAIFRRALSREEVMALYKGGVEEKGYRFGFNGQEKDEEIKGRGNSVDFGARIYDNRLGRWLSPDMYESKHPQLSTYSFAANSPILLVDRDGNDWFLNPWTTNAQKEAFKNSIENRFDGVVKVSFENVKYKTTITSYDHRSGRTVTKPIEVEQIQVKMTINEEKLKQKIINENPNATADDITNLTHQYVSDLKSSSTYSYLDEQFNTKKNADVWGITLAGTFPIADYKSKTINAEALARSGHIGFAMLYHEIAEQAAKAQGLKLEGFNEANGYPSAHWFGLQKQAEEMGGVMVINNLEGGSLSLTLYKEIRDNKTGDVTDYKALEYSLQSDHFKTTIHKTGETSLTVEEYNSAVSAAKEDINDNFKDEE